jgi:hypothetical protein
MRHFILQAILAGFFCALCANEGNSSTTLPREELANIYQVYRTSPSDINEHLSALKSLACECSSIAEIGRRSSGSTWALLMGLAENENPKRKFVEVELSPSLMLEKLYLAKRLAHENGITFHFKQGNDLYFDLEENVDLLFIDSIHTYCHLTYELEKFSPKVNKYIVMHDTSPPWGYVNDSEYTGDYSEYPQEIDRTKKGLSPAIVDFLSKNKGWFLKERRFNNHGLVILERAGKVQLSQNPQIHVFVHTCTITKWQEVLNRQLERIRASGLYEAADSINLGVLGNGDLAAIREKFPKVNILFQIPNISLYERPTLLALHDLALKDPADSLILYLHTKGKESPERNRRSPTGQC